MTIKQLNNEQEAAKNKTENNQESNEIVTETTEKNLIDDESKLNKK